MGLFRYLLQYRLRDVADFLRNEERPPFEGIGSLEGKTVVILPAAKDPTISARALLYLSISEDIKKDSGRFFNLTAPEKPAPHARDSRMADAVWTKSLALCGLS